MLAGGVCAYLFHVINHQFVYVHLFYIILYAQSVKILFCFCSVFMWLQVAIAARYN